MEEKDIIVDDDYLKNILKKSPLEKEPKEIAYIETIVEVRKIGVIDCLLIEQRVSEQVQKLTEAN